MGFLASVAGLGSSLHAFAGFRDPSSGVRIDEGRPDVFRDTGAAVRHNRELAIKLATGRQTALADLVGLVEPDDAEEIAHELLDAFGSVGEVFSAPNALLASKSRNQAIANAICVARDLVLAGLSENVQRNTFDASAPELLQYLIGTMKGEQEEHLHAIFLDQAARYISDERMFSGSWTAIEVRLRPIMRRSIELNAAKIVLYHNHPSGNVNPSEADHHFTKQAIGVGRVLGIEIFDHMIVAGPSVFSMRRAGLLS